MPIPWKFTGCIPRSPPSRSHISGEFIIISSSFIPLKFGSPDGHGRLSLRKGDGYIGNVIRGSISQRDTLGCLSPAVDSSHPTLTDRQYEFGQRTGSKSLMPVIVPICRRTPDSSVSNSIRKRIPTEIRVWYTAFTYLVRGTTNSQGLALGL